MRLEQLFAFGIAFCLAAALPALIALSLTTVVPTWDAQLHDSGFTSPKGSSLPDMRHPHRLPQSPTGRWRAVPLPH